VQEAVRSVQHLVHIQAGLLPFDMENSTRVDLRQALDELEAVHDTLYVHCVRYLNCVHDCMPSRGLVSLLLCRVHQQSSVHSPDRLVHHPQYSDAGLGGRQLRFA
jgi:hypothetical protein